MTEIPKVSITEFLAKMPVVEKLISDLYMRLKNTQSDLALLAEAQAEVGEQRDALIKKLRDENAALRTAFRVNMLRLQSHLSHSEIDRLLAEAVPPVEGLNPVQGSPDAWL